MEKSVYNSAYIMDITLEGDQLIIGLTSGPWVSTSIEDLHYISLPANKENLKLKQETLVKFEGTNPTKLIIVPAVEKSYEEFQEIKSKIATMTCEELVETYRSLIGKVCCGKPLHVKFIFEIIHKDYGSNIPVEFGQNLVDFLGSKEVSDYLKIWMYEKSKSNNLPGKNPKLIENALKIAKSDKNINDFTEEEFATIYLAFQGIPHSLENEIINIALRYNSEGSTEFLNNWAYSETLIKKILRTSGLNDDAEYYFGRGVRRSDLSEAHLKSVYDKLKKISKEKAENFLKMVMDMNTLGATEFIKSLYNLARNGYIYDKKVIVKVVKNSDINGNLSVDGNFIKDLNRVIENISVGTESIRSGFLSLLPAEEAEAYRRVRGTNYEHRSN